MCWCWLINRSSSRTELATMHNWNTHHPSLTIWHGSQMVQIHYNNYKHIPESNGLLRGNNSQRNRACAASTRDFADLARRQYYKITTVGKCIGLNAFYFRVQDTDHISMILLVQPLVAPEPAFPARNVASTPRHTWPSTLLSSVTVVERGQQTKLLVRPLVASKQTS